MSGPQSALRRLALIDTGAYFALSVTRDTNHAPARAIGQQLIAERWQLYTTNFILAENYDPQPPKTIHPRAGPCDHLYSGWLILRNLPRVDGAWCNSL